MVTSTPLHGDINSIQHWQKIVEEYYILYCFFVCSLFDAHLVLRIKRIWRVRRLQFLVQGLVSLLDIHLDLYKKNRLEAQKYSIITYFMICNLVAMLAKYLDLYWSPEFDFYLDIMLVCWFEENMVFLKYLKIGHNLDSLVEYLTGVTLD